MAEGRPGRSHLMRRLLLNSSALTVGSALAQLATAIALLLGARVLGPGTFGAFVGLFGLVSLAATVIDFGINAATIRWLASHAEDAAAFVTTLSAKVFLAFVLGGTWVAVSMAAMAVGALTVEIGVASVLLGVYLVASVTSTTLAVPLRARQRMTTVAIGSVAEKLVVLLVAAVLLLGPGWGPETLGLGFAAGSVASGIFYAALLAPPFRVAKVPAGREIIELWRQSRELGLSSISVQLQRADVAVVGFVAGTEAAGIFAIPARLTNLLGIIPTAFSAALYPRVAARGHSSETMREAVNVGAVMLATTAAGLAVLFAAADWIVPLLLGPAYVGAVPVLRVYVVAMLAASMTQPMAVYLQAIHQETYVARTVMTAAVIGLLFVGIGSATGGAMGAAYGFAAQQALVLLSLAAWFAKGIRASSWTPKGEESA